MSQLNLSARAYHRTRSVKLARTIADLAAPPVCTPVLAYGARVRKCREGIAHSSALEVLIYDL